jgi:hypothetical protein
MGRSSVPRFIVRFTASYQLSTASERECVCVCVRERERERERESVCACVRATPVRAQPHDGDPIPQTRDPRTTRLKVAKDPGRDERAARRHCRAHL